MNPDRNYKVDPSSGFLQTTVDRPDIFDSDSKSRFLEYYKSNGLRLNSTCKAIGVKRDTVKKHMELDPNFRNAVREIEDDWKQELEAISKESALNPKNVIERIFHMKCHLPDLYGQEFKTNNQAITINVQGNLLVDAKKRAEMIDAEIVKEIKQESANMLAGTMHTTDNNTILDGNVKDVDGERDTKSSI